MEQMRSVLKEAKTTICKSQRNIIKYYSRCHMSVSVFKPGNKVYLDSIDIHTTCLSVKLVHQQISLYVMEK